VLVEKDALDQQITALVASQSKGVEQNENGPAVSRQDISEILAEKEQAVDRTQQIIAHADELRIKVEKAREEIAKKKAIIERRKSELAAASNGVEARRTRQIEEVEKSIRMSKYKWNQTHAVTASSRAFLCGEAAKLYGLRWVKKNGGLEEYKIGGIGIIDLRAMNSKFVPRSYETVLIPLCSRKPSPDFNGFITYRTSFDTVYTLPSYSSPS
jgi:hypothetical protein